MEERIAKAQESLIEWLAHPNELGKKPSTVVYVKKFVDEDGIECLIFKYKKTFFGNWLLGIVSDSGTFSEMKEFNEATAVEDATEILEMLKNYWKQLANKLQEEAK